MICKYVCTIAKNRFGLVLRFSYLKKGTVLLYNEQLAYITYISGGGCIMKKIF